MCGGVGMGCGGVGVCQNPCFHTDFHNKSTQVPKIQTLSSLQSGFPGKNNKIASE